MDTPFASVQDLKDRWPDFPPGGDTFAATLLEDASQFILDVAPQAEHASEGTLRRVVCSVVRRAMTANAAGQIGVTESQISTGPFSASYQSTNPHGDFYLTKQELKALGGAGRPRAFGIEIETTETSRHRPWCSLMFGATYCSCGVDLTGDYPLWEA